MSGPTVHAQIDTAQASRVVLSLWRGREYTNPSTARRKLGMRRSEPLLALAKRRKLFT